MQILPRQWVMVNDKVNAQIEKCEIRSLHAGRSVSKHQAEM